MLSQNTLAFVNVGAFGRSNLTKTITANERADIHIV